MISTSPRLGTATFTEPVAVIGDIHGMAGMLRELLRQLPRGMPIVVAGDVCDRGPDSRGAVDLLLERGAIGVRGNHDDWMIDWVSGRPFPPFALSPGMKGAETLDSYGISCRDPDDLDEMRREIPSSHRDFFRSLFVAMDLTVCGHPYWVIHAGIPSHVSFKGLRPERVVPWLAVNEPDTLLWPKNRAEEMVPVDRVVIMGHVPRAAPIDTGTVLAIDTGAGRGGRLTAAILPERRFVTVG